MNPPAPEELQAQMNALKSEMERRMQAIEDATKYKFEKDDMRFGQIENRLDRIEAALDKLTTRVDRLSDRLVTTAIAMIVTIITSMTFILNYATPLALLRNLPKDVVIAPAPASAPTSAPASLPDTKPAKDHPEKVVR